MNQFFYQITRKASDLINSDDYRERNITRQTAFTRNRKLSFPVMIVLLLNFLTRTMQIELDDFFANVLDAGTDSVTKQAFFKARKNILPDAFKELFLMTRDMVLNKNKIKRHKGYRILAIDGSELRLDKTKENKDIFLPRNHSPENKTNAEISLLYDVISHYVIDAQIGSIGVCEREYAKKNLAYFSSICDEKDIVIFDRGYPSRDMIATLTGMGCKYLMRLQASCFKGVKENPSNDFRITVSTKTDTYSLTGKEKQKFAKKCSYELEQYKAAFAKVKTMFPDTKTPTAETLRKQQTELREQFEKRSAEYNYYKKEADRLARQIRQKRDSQKTIDRYLQNEQAAKRKKNQLE